MIPVIAVRLPEKDKATGERLYDGIYDKDGRPTCIGGKSMEYALTDPEEGHLFRCPAEGCSLKETVQFTRHCDYWHYEKPEGRLLRIVGLLPPLLRRMESRVQEASDHRATLQQRQAKPPIRHAPLPEHRKGVTARGDVDAGILGYGLGPPESRRLRPYAAHADQAAEGPR